MKKPPVFIYVEDAAALVAKITAKPCTVKAIRLRAQRKQLPFFRRAGRIVFDAAEGTFLRGGTGARGLRRASSEEVQRDAAAMTRREVEDRLDAELGAIVTPYTGTTRGMSEFRWFGWDASLSALIDEALVEEEAE